MTWATHWIRRTLDAAFKLGEFRVAAVIAGFLDECSGLGELTAGDVGVLLGQPTPRELDASARL